MKLFHKTFFVAEPLLWQQQFRFRHVTTRQYLAINDEHHVTLINDPSDPHTVFKLHPVPQESDEVTFDKNARIEHVITGSWLHALKGWFSNSRDFDPRRIRTSGAFVLPSSFSLQSKIVSNIFSFQNFYLFKILNLHFLISHADISMKY